MFGLPLGFIVLAAIAFIALIFVARIVYTSPKP